MKSHKSFGLNVTGVPRVGEVQSRMVKKQQKKIGAEEIIELVSDSNLRKRMLGKYGKMIK